MSSREIQKRLKELAAALKAEPGSIPRRLELAAALREAQRPADAIDLYRGVAEVYAEEGRLVQAMAVCKGILEIDPEHRDTLEMLANLAQRRASARKGEAQLRQVDGRWVAEPQAVTAVGRTPRSGPEPPLDAPMDAMTPPSMSGLAPIRRSDETPAEPPRLGRPTGRSDLGINWGAPEDSSGSSTRAGGDPDATRVGDDAEDVRHAMWNHTPPDGVAIADAPATDTDPSATAPNLDFDLETKSKARGDKLLELTPPPAEKRELDTLRVTSVTDDELAAIERADTPVIGEKPPAMQRTNSSDETRAAVRAALNTGRPVSEAPDHTTIGLPPGMSGDLYPVEDEVGATLIQDVLTAPFPRPALMVEPPPFPLLSDLPRGAFMELLARLTVLHLEAGQNVLKEGEMGDACYLIASGSVRVTKGGVEVAVLGPGSFFGEFAVLADQRRHASVETIEPVELLEIRRQLLDELVAAHPGVARTLRRFYRERLLSTLMATAPFFQRLQPEERAGIAERFRPRRFGRGARIIEEGSPGGGLFLILVGEVQVVRGAVDAEVELGALGEGSYFGEMSLLRGGVASATVRAARMTEVVQLPPRDFYEVVSQHPVLWEQLRSEAERREMANHAILAGEARKSEDGTIYLV
jgi:CRP-like cAMP-binding protein